MSSREKVLLVSPYFYRVEDRSQLPAGVYLIKNFFQENGVSTEVLDLNRALEDEYNLYEASIELIKEKDPDYVGFSVMSTLAPDVMMTVKKLKEEMPDVSVFLGGPHVEVAGEDIIESFDEVDFAVRGEGKNTVSGIADYIKGNKPVEDLPGAIFRKEGETVVNTVPGFLGGKEIPEMDFDNPPEYDVYYVEGGRGCPFNCKFCPGSEIYGDSYRVVPPERLAQNIERLNKKVDTKYFSLTHDLFTLREERVRNFCREAEKYSFEWACYARVDTIDRELLEVMDESGCSGIFIGVETGDQQFQQKIRKGLDLEQVDDIIEFTLEETGINLTVSLIIGIPGTDRSIINKTMEKAAIYGSRGAKVSLWGFRPVRGSRFYEEVRNDLVFEGSIYRESREKNFQTDEEIEMVRENPLVFSDHYLVDNENFNRFYISSVVRVFDLLVDMIPGSLKLLVEETEKNLLKHIEEMMGWKESEVSERQWEKIEKHYILQRAASYIEENSEEVRKTFFEEISEYKDRTDSF